MTGAAIDDYVHCQLICRIIDESFIFITCQKVTKKFEKKSSQFSRDQSDVFELG